jgi:hypothetical protein
MTPSGSHGYGRQGTQSPPYKAAVSRPAADPSAGVVFVFCVVQLRLVQSHGSARLLELIAHLKQHHDAQVDTSHPSTLAQAPTQQKAPHHL